MSERKLNIVVCDDHKLFRKGIVGLLEDFDEIEEIKEAGNGVELLQLLEILAIKPDLILLDINMPEMDGIQAAPKIRSKYPDTKIIILSMEDDTQIVSHLVSEGVNGYLLKNADPDELELAIKMVTKNGFYFSSSLSSTVLGSLKTKAETVAAVEVLDLNEREIEILQMTCKELTAAEIAKELVLSTRTVEGYKRKLLEKTGTKNIAGLVIFAIKNNLVEI